MIDVKSNGFAAIGEADNVEDTQELIRTQQPCLELRYILKIET